MNHSNFSASKNARVNAFWKWLGLLAWLAVTAILLSHYSDRLYSTSIDVGLHGTLVSRLMETWDVSVADANLAVMASYPRIAHLLAAIIGVQADSAIDGMQYAAYFFMAVLWTAIGISLLRLPRRKFVFASVALALLLVANRQWIGLEIFGSEMVVTYFFAHFVAQSISICLLVVALQREWARPKSVAPMLVLGLGAVLLTSVHLLPAVELLATLATLIALNFLADSGERNKRSLIFGIAIFMLSFALTVANPDFLAMYGLSANNGLMRLKHIENLRDMTLLVAVVILFSIALITFWWRKRRQDVSYEALLFKYFGAFGLSMAGLCLFQTLLFVWMSKGSEYASLKYATGLQSIALIDMALLLSLFARSQLCSGRIGPQVLFPTILAMLAFICVFPKGNFILTGNIIDAERDARAFAQSNRNLNPEIHDFAIGIGKIDAIGNYLVSRFALRAPALGESYEFLLGKIPKDPAHINRILTSRDAVPWDVPACRQGTAGSLVVLDGACVFGEFDILKCAGTIEFSSLGALDKASMGLSSPGPNGRWSEGSAASLTCEVSDPVAQLAYLTTAGLVSNSHTQTMVVSVNEEPPQTIEYSIQAPSRTVAIPLPAKPWSRLTFKFSFPNAISPRELGMNTDERVLAVMMYQLRFEP